MNYFQFSVEETKFKYLGCEIQKLENGNITLNQKEKILKIIKMFNIQRKEIQLQQMKQKEKKSEELWESYYGLA